MANPMHSHMYIRSFCMRAVHVAVQQISLWFVTILAQDLSFPTFVSQDCVCVCCSENVASNNKCSYVSTYVYHVRRPARRPLSPKLYIDAMLCRHESVYHHAVIPRQVHVAVSPDSACVNC